MKAAVYARISRDGGAEALGVARQLEDCRRLAETRGWTVEVEFVDNDVSAYSGTPRPGYEDLLKAIEGGVVGAVVAWHPDRLHRSPRELERFIDVVEAAGCRVATVQAGELDLATASGRMTARVVGAVARHESEQKSERLRRKARELAEAGKVGGGGTRPFGYETDRVTVRESEAEVIRGAYERLLEGMSFKGVTEWMGTVSTPVLSTRWQRSSVRRLLLSPRIAGLRQHRGEVVGEAVWPAIVDRDDWERVRVLLESRRRGGRAPRYLLTGILVCGLCGARLVARPRADKRRTVVCATGYDFSGCGKIRQLVEPLDAMVTEAVLEAIDRPELWTRIRDGEAPDVAAAHRRVAELERRLAEVGHAYGTGALDDISWRSARTALVDELGEARRVAAQTIGVGATWFGRGGDLRAEWPDLPIGVRREVVASVVERIVIGPAVRGRNFFQPERVSIEWL